MSRPQVLCALCALCVLSALGYSTFAPAVGAAAVAVFVADAVAFALLVPVDSVSEPSPRSSMSEIGALSPRRGPN